MQIRPLLTIFASVFMAELGDKTQLATLCFAANGECSPWGVFIASSAALVASSLIAVLVGSQLSRFISPQYLKIGAGAMFIIIGAWVLWGAIKS